jgi:hypothetical protein
MQGISGTGSCKHRDPAKSDKAVSAPNAVRGGKMIRKTLMFGLVLAMAPMLAMAAQRFVVVEDAYSEG